MIIKQKRLSLGISQFGLAKTIKTNQQHMSQIECLTIKPKTATLDRIISVLGIPKEQERLVYFEYGYLHPDIHKVIAKNPEKVFKKILK